MDVNQVPSQSLLGLLARYAEDKEEKESLTVLANDDEIYDKWREDGRDICLTLQEFVSVNINSSLLISQLSLIKPRRYSIASAPRGQTLSLVVGVVGYSTSTGRNKTGLASGRTRYDLPRHVMSLSSDYQCQECSTQQRWAPPSPGT